MTKKKITHTNHTHCLTLGHELDYMYSMSHATLLWALQPYQKITIAIGWSLHMRLVITSQEDLSFEVLESELRCKSCLMPEYRFYVLLNDYTYSPIYQIVEPILR